jgi:hypothetical protein
MHLKVNTKRLVKANGLALGSRINQPRNKKRGRFFYGAQLAGSLRQAASDLIVSS